MLNFTDEQVKTSRVCAWCLKSAPTDDEIQHSKTCRGNAPEGTLPGLGKTSYAYGDGYNLASC